MSKKEEALRDIVAIARNNGLGIADISAALANVPANVAQEQSSVLSRLFGYIGGIFVFAGLCIFIGMQWDDMTSPARVLVTLGSGFAAYLIGLIAIDDPRYERAATPLLLIAAFLQAGGLFVMLNEYSSGGNPKHGILFVAGVMLLQQALTFAAKRRTTLAFTSIFFGGMFFCQLMDIAGFPDDLIFLTAGASLICIAWALSRSPHAAIAGCWYFWGSLGLFYAVFDILEHSGADILFLGLAAFMIYVSTRARSRTLLFTSTGAMMCYIGYFTQEHFRNTLGWPISLIIIGMALIGLGAAAVRINNKYIKQG